MNKRTASFWLKVILTAQILTGMTCLGLSYRAIYVTDPLKNFIATQARAEKDLERAIPDSINHKYDLINAVKEEMVSLKAESLAFASLLFICASLLIILPSFIFFIIKNVAIIERQNETPKS